MKEGRFVNLTEEEMTNIDGGSIFDPISSFLTDVLGLVSSLLGGLGSIFGSGGSGVSLLGSLSSFLSNLFK